MRQSILLSLALILATIPLYAGDGSSCEQAIEVQSGVHDLSLEPGDYWFTAWTYDLPMTVTFFPTNQSNPKCPTAEVDFSCNGIYDPEVARALGIGTSSYVQLPIRLTGTPVTVDGKKGYTVSMDAQYRELMFRAGITHDIQAWVKLHVDQAGSGQAIPDTVTRSCLNSSYTVKKEDTLTVAADDTETAYVFFFKQWTQDSLTMTWTGSAPATLWLGGDDCGFEPNQDESFTHYDFTSGEAKRFSINEVEDLIRIYGNGGVYYGKAVSSSAGQLRLNITPEAPIPGIRLEYNRSAEVRANEDTVYFFKKNWTATRFEVPTKDSVFVYFGKTPTIHPADPSTYVLCFALDQAQDSTHYMELSEYETEHLFRENWGVNENYVFMRLLTKQATSVTPYEWTPSTPFANKTYQVRPDYTFTIGSTDAVKKNIYRMRLSEWKNCELTIARPTAQSKSFNMAIMNDTAATNVSSTYALEGSYVQLKASGNDNVKLYHTYDTATVNSWEGQFTQDSVFVYWFFNQNSKKTQLTFTRRYLAPVPPEPPTPTYLENTFAFPNGEPQTVVFINMTTGECKTFKLPEGKQIHMNYSELGLSSGLYRVNVGANRPYLLRVE